MLIDNLSRSVGNTWTGERDGIEAIGETGGGITESGEDGGGVETDKKEVTGTINSLLVIVIAVLSVRFFASSSSVTWCLLLLSYD